MIPSPNGRETMGDAEYGAKIVEGLVGATIARALIDKSGESFGFVARFPDGTEKAVWVLCDEEGNGPGALSVEALKKKKPLHETNEYEIHREGKQISIVVKANGEVYQWPAKSTATILQHIAENGAERTCEILMKKTG